MIDMHERPLFDIQLFGEGAGGGDGGTGAGMSGESPAGQESAAPAQPQTKGAKRSSLAEVRYGKQEAPAAGEQTEPAQPATPDREATWQSMIRGDYKDLFEAQIRDIVGKRLKATEETVRRFGELEPVLDLLARKYGVDSKDIKGLGKAIEEDDSFYEDEALEQGLTVQQLKEKRKMLRENAALRQQLQEQTRREQADRQYAQWVREGEALKRIYPGFDLRKEVQDEGFRQLLRSGVPLQTADEVVHKDEIIPAVMHVAAQEAEQRVADSVRAGRLRPAEGAMGGHSSAITKSDVSQLTRADRDEIDRRVARGERIMF